jgi:hypothetical protein
LASHLKKKNKTKQNKKIKKSKKEKEKMLKLLTVVYAYFNLLLFVSCGPVITKSWNRCKTDATHPRFGGCGQHAVLLGYPQREEHRVRAFLFIVNSTFIHLTTNN